MSSSSRVFASLFASLIILALPGLGLSATRTGFLVVDAQTGQTLAARAPDDAFITASVMKLVTAMAALDRLGPQHRLRTTLSTAGQIEDGVLVGDVVIEGTGDVQLDLDDLMAFALALRQAGIRDVEGRFLVSDDAFLRQDAVNPEQPLDAGYNAGVGPLSLAFGRVTMLPRPSGGYFTNPPLFERGPGWRIAKGLSPAQPRSLPVRDVGMHAARSLRRMANDLGIILPVPVRGVTQAQVRTLIDVPSQPVAELVEGMLVYSNNQLAETLGLATAKALTLAPETLAESATAIWQDVATRLGDTNWQGFRITNHSGLDPDARATPAQMVSLLNYGLERHALPHMLPANGWSGSLSKRLVEEEILQRVWAKTGSLDFATALAGYLVPEGGGLLMFALFSDDPERRAVYDNMPEPTAAIRAEAATWEAGIKNQHDQFLRLWLRRQF